MSTRTDAAEVQAHFVGDEMARLPQAVQAALASIVGFATQVDDDRARAAWMVSELSAREVDLATEMLSQPGAPLELQQAAQAATTALIWTVDRLREADPDA